MYLQEWQQFYLSTVLLIFLIAMVLQWPRLNVSSNLKLAVFVAWAAYGVVPTFHWTLVMGGTANPVVQVFLFSIRYIRDKFFGLHNFENWCDLIFFFHKSCFYQESLECTQSVV